MSESADYAERKDANGPAAKVVKVPILIQMKGWSMVRSRTSGRYRLI